MLKEIQTSSASGRMTTREIASLTGKEHFHVMRDVQNMFCELQTDREEIKGYIQEWIHPQNKQTYVEYALPKNLTICLVSGYKAKLRLKIINRWQELESKAPALPQTFSEALQLAADQARVIEEQAPKVEVYEKLAARKESVSTTELAKQLGVSAKKLNEWLKYEGFKFKHFKDLPTEKKPEWFNVISGVSNYTGKEFKQCLITPLGQIEIAKRFKK